MPVCVTHYEKLTQTQTNHKLNPQLFSATNSLPYGTHWILSTLLLFSYNPIIDPSLTLTTPNSHSTPNSHQNFSKKYHSLVMMKEEVAGGDGSVAGGNSWARVCDTCRSAACTVYCRADSAYLCADCDGRVHAANRVASRHERVWVCEACERAPAAYLCKADAASLCTACDADIHSANPLARRHQRVPILPISGCGEVADTFMTTQDGDDHVGEEDEDEASSWLLLNPAKNCTNQSNNNNGFLFGSGEADEYLDLVEYNSCAENQYNDQFNQPHFGHVTQKVYGGDSVVPVQNNGPKDSIHSFQLGLEVSKASYSYNGSINHSMYLSSMDIGVVPESTFSEISNSHAARTPKGTIDLFSGHPIQMPQQLSAMDREARVLRYREKKKNRKFEKTIRYASRKAYAETRLRIKGRFAKRTDVDQVDQMFSTALMAETAYGIVPSI